jgi:hypothetical protein
VWGSSKYEFEEPHDGLRDDGSDLHETYLESPRRHPRLAQVALANDPLSVSICLPLRFGVEQFLQVAEPLRKPYFWAVSNRPVEG